MSGIINVCKLLLVHPFTLQVSPGFPMMFSQPYSLRRKNENQEERICHSLLPLDLYYITLTKSNWNNKITGPWRNMLPSHENLSSPELHCSALYFCFQWNISMCGLRWMLHSGHHITIPKRKVEKKSKGARRKPFTIYDGALQFMEHQSHRSLRQPMAFPGPWGGETDPTFWWR